MAEPAFGQPRGELGAEHPIGAQDGREPSVEADHTAQLQFVGYV